MNNLIDRGLIEAKGRLDAPGRPMLYGTTQDFLRSFGINDLSALPNTSDELNALFSSAKSSDEDVLPDQQTIDFDAAEKPVENTADEPERQEPTVAQLDLDDEVSAEDDIIPEE
jgi:hypothetical protein